MIAKTYGIYDSVQQEYIQTFTAKNDADAIRTADLIVRTPNFDNVSYKDRSIVHLFDIDTCLGQIVDTTQRQIFNFSTAIEARNREELEKSVQEKIFTQDFKDEVKSYVLSSLKGLVNENK